tara:strand:+ start:468 stop:671 length:204 start_codon:yes stop_codon:yes gene_type:complete
MKKNKPENTIKELSSLAVFVHGSLFALHGLGFMYNLKRKNWQAATIHGATGIWDFVCAIRHLDETKD